MSTKCELMDSFGTTGLSWLKRAAPVINLCNFKGRFSTGITGIFNSVIDSIKATSDELMEIINNVFSEKYN